MKIRFWGVRGSIATPGAKTNLYGGNTACVEVYHGGERIILDAGTGIRLLGKQLAAAKSPARELHLLLSHFHIDHLCGLPFFAPLYRKGVMLHLYGPKGFRRTLKQILSAFFSEEFFPVPITKIPARLAFHPLGDRTFRVGKFSIHSFVINHPGHTLGYILQVNNRRVAYLSDHEPIKGFRHLGKKTAAAYQAKLLKRLQGVDLLIHDAQFSNETYDRYRGWGHSPWSYPVTLAEAAQVKQLVLFHHAPEHEDHQLQETNRTLQTQLKKNKSPLVIIMAREGMIIPL